MGSLSPSNEYTEQVSHLQINRSRRNLLDRLTSRLLLEGWERSDSETEKVELEGAASVLVGIGRVTAEIGRKRRRRRRELSDQNNRTPSPKESPCKKMRPSHRSA